MAFKLPGRVLESFTTTGTGTITLGGAVSGYRTFASALSNSDTTHYFMFGGSDWEEGYGTYTGGTLARTTVLASSNGGSAVSWAAGTKYVGVGLLGLSDLDATNLGRLQGALGISTFIQTLLDDATAAAAQATLGMREVLTGARTYYVRTDGSDSNTGLANTSGGAFLTIQKAVNVVAALDRSTYNVTISVGSGTFTGAVTITGWGPGSGTVTIDGAGLASTTISTTSANCFTVSAAAVTITNMKLQTTTSGQCIRGTHGAVITFGSIDFGAAASIAHIWVDGGVRLVCSANYTISGNAARHLFARYSGCSVEIAGRTITLTGTPAFGGAFIDASACATLEMSSNTFSGSATGVRYSVVTNAVVSTSGGGSTYFPGNSAGSTATGGQYT